VFARTFNGPHVWYYRRLENGRAVRTFYDAPRCHTRVHTHWIGGFQKVLEVMKMLDDNGIDRALTGTADPQIRRSPFLG
jgi:hypothetical protein